MSIEFGRYRMEYMILSCDLNGCFRSYENHRELRGKDRASRRMVEDKARIAGWEINGSEAYCVEHRTYRADAMLEAGDD